MLPLQAHINVITKDRQDICAYDDDRRNFCHRFSWAIPSSDVIETIALFVNNRQVLEVAAGSGLWANLLQQRGVKIHPTDISGKPYKHYHHAQKRYTHVEKIGAVHAIKKYKPQVLFMCWPEYNSKWTGFALKEFLKHARKGCSFIYIGEPEYGCTGDEQFHKLRMKMKLITCDYSHPKWDGIYDKLFLYNV